jgi:1,2-dihydroxy-3-keto-5-methylthiopentene dioxygenase
VPAGTRHWFDMGPAPRFTAIRLFTTPAGWVANFTGTPIARNFPSYGTAPA